MARRGEGLRGTVREILPRALYRVALMDGNEIVAHAAAGPKRNFVRLVVGDTVIVELAEKDLTRGRVVRRA